MVHPTISQFIYLVRYLLNNSSNTKPFL